MDPAQPSTFAGLVALGAGAGFLSTLFGIGGGVVIVPVLVYGLGVDFHVATATSLAAMLAHPPLGVYQHARRGAVDWRLAGLLVAGGAVGVPAGIVIEGHVGTSWLKFLFALIMVGAAWRLVAKPPRVHEEPHPALGVVALGVVAGAASRLFGIGGGLVSVPMLAFLGTRMHAAVGSSLVAVFTNAALASAVSLSKGLDWHPAVPIALGAVCAATFGTRAAHGLRAQPLARLFAAALTLAAIYVAATSGVV
ncbi:MAG: sulfite exporter TauE/SafE family protein [bacterium]